MCGIFGFVDKRGTRSTCEILADSLTHRGPDSNGFYYNDKNGFCIGNTRLSIIDLEKGNQPFYSADNQIIVVQNGEIYNYLEVKKKLESKGVIFDTNSDTEVILRAYEYWGSNFISRLNGMFAIAIIDQNSDNLLLYRDRLGVKPLYILSSDERIYFSSEIKSFLKLDFFDRKINNQSIADYLIFNFVPIPQTIYENVFHLKPGSYLQIKLKNVTDQKETFYWRYSEFAQSKNKMDDQDILKQTEGLIEDATKIRLRSDVEVGAFLSGGLDSSIVCAIMRHQLQEKQISAYSIGFHNPNFDESVYAKYVSEKYDLKQNLKFLEDNIVDQWPLTTFYCDQPHGDTSFIPTSLLAKEAVKNNKVVLSGDGGDELFGGYEKYLEIKKVGFENYIENNRVISNDALNDILHSSFRKKINSRNYLEIIRTSTSQDLDDINKAMSFDVLQLFPGNNLVKPDKMAMMHSLEVRSPLLDYRLYELLAGVEGERKIRAGELKYYLKQISKKYFKESHIYRRKQMFTVPVGEWLKSELKVYGERLLFDGRLENRELINMSTLKRIWKEHITGEFNHTRKIRAIMNLEIWFRSFHEKN